MKRTILLVVLFVGGCVMAQASPDQPSREKKGQVRVQGCVSRSSGDYILMQSDPGNSYVLHAASKVKLGQFLGQRVEVSGSKSPTLSDSSDAGRSPAAVTIMVNSIKTISKECN